MGTIKTTEQRKQESIAFLKSKGIPTIDWLPMTVFCRKPFTQKRRNFGLGRPDIATKIGTM